VPPEGKDSRTDTTPFIIVPETKKTHKDGQRHTVCRIASLALSCMFIDLRLCDLAIQYSSYDLGLVTARCQVTSAGQGRAGQGRAGQGILNSDFEFLFFREVSITIGVAQ